MCGKLETLWIPYLDGNVNEEERALVEGHLAECAECARRRDEFLAVSQALAAWEAPDPSPWFDAKLRRRIEAQAGARGGLRRFFELFPIPASFAILLVLAALLLSTGTQPPASPARPAEFANEARMEEVFHAAEEVELLNNFELLSELKKPEMPPARGGH